MFNSLLNSIISQAHCQEGAGYLKRADTDRLHEIFLKFATVDKNGEKFITSEDFVRKFLGLFDEDDYNKQSVELIAGIVDMDKNGLISFPEFQAFEGLLCVPDALYKTAFQLFDTNGNGLVAFDEFAEVMNKTVLNKKLPFNMESTFVRLYFGKDKKRLVTYSEFSQFLHDFHEEYGVEAFKKCDKDGSGFISAADFKEIMLSIKSHLLTKEMKAKVIDVPLHSAGSPGRARRRRRRREAMNPAAAPHTQHSTGGLLYTDGKGTIESYSHAIGNEMESWLAQRRQRSEA